MAYIDISKSIALEEGRKCDGVRGGPEEHERRGWRGRDGECLTVVRVPYVFKSASPSEFSI